MKNLLIYLNPEKRFRREAETLARIQVDNAQRLGDKDLLLVTNFPWTYNGVKAIEIDGKDYCYFRPRSTNTVAIPQLFDMGLIEPEEIYWVHDFDAYQNHPMTVEFKAEMGLTTYGWSQKWCMGSFFFKKEAEDVFRLIKEAVYGLIEEDERVLRALTRANYGNINTRYQVLNITYNFGMRKIEVNYPIADKPIKVLHFHPSYKETGLDTREIFVRGNNCLGLNLMSDGLRKVFVEHGIQ